MLPWSVRFLAPLEHAHEMLFGFALAVLAGNQLPAMPPWRRALLFGTWAAARLALLAPQGSIAAPAANALFAGLLAAHAAPRLFGAAKKLRNQALPAVVTAICLAVFAFHAARIAEEPAAPRTVLAASVLLFALLLLFMGGRIIAPAVAGQLYRQGQVLEARVQPRIEAALIVVMAAAVVGVRHPIGAYACIIAGVLAAVRLVRWRLWACRGRPDLICLASGYAWLALGLVLLGLAKASGQYESTALHLITAGALGTLTFNVMATTWLLKARREPSRMRALVWGTALIATATLARGAAGLIPPAYPELIAFAALAWSAAYFVLLGVFALANRN